MTEIFLRRTLLIGTIVCGVALGALALDSLHQVVSARTPPLSPEVVAGKRVFQQRNCNDCHTILGIGGYYAPELTRVVERRDDAWLRKFLKNPSAAKPGTNMPDQHLSDAEVDQLLAFHRWVDGIDTNGWPPLPKIGGTSNAGALLFNQKGCADCHRLNGVGASDPGPDLTLLHDRSGARTRVSAWLNDPEKQKPDTIMPRPELTSAERAALVAYIAEGR